MYFKTMALKLPVSVFSHLSSSCTLSHVCTAAFCPEVIFPRGQNCSMKGTVVLLLFCKAKNAFHSFCVMYDHHVP